MADNEETQEEETWMEDVSENKIVQLVGLAVLLAATKGAGGKWAVAGKFGSGAAGKMASGKGLTAIGSIGIIGIIDEWWNNRDDETPEEAVDGAIENGLQAVAEEKLKEVGPITAADQRNDVVTEIAQEANVSVQQAAAAVDAANIQELSNPGPGSPDPSGQTTWLVSDAYLHNTMDPTTFAFNTDFLPYRKGQDLQGMRGSQDYTGMLGTQDIQFYGIRPHVEGGGRGSPETPESLKPISLSWTMDRRKLPDNYQFISIVEKDAPFTVSDAIGIYNKQDEEGKRKIAQGLALGDQANGSYTYQVLGREMFINPDSIYDDDVVEAAIIKMSNAAESRARQLNRGYADLGDTFNPTTVLDKPESLGSFQDDLFDMAVDAGMVTQITAEYGRELGRRALSNLTGMSEVAGFSDMIDGWIEDIQRTNMGQSLSQAEILEGIETRIEDAPEFEEAVVAKGMAVRRAHLGRAMAGRGQQV